LRSCRRVGVGDDGGRRLFPDLFLDAVQCGNKLYCFVGNKRTACLVKVKELAPNVREAGNFSDIATLKELLIASIAIRMQITLILFAMVLRPCAFSVG